MSARVGFARGLRAHPEDLPELPYAWLEAPRAAELTWLEEVENWMDAEVWPQGRIFGEAGEYRWRREADGAIHGVLVLEQGELPSCFEGQLPLSESTDRSLLLWGEWVDPTKDKATNPDSGPVYYTPDLPKPQTYPLKQEERQLASGDLRPCFKVRTYRSAEGTFQRAVAVELREKKDVEEDEKGTNDA